MHSPSSSLFFLFVVLLVVVVLLTAVFSSAASLNSFSKQHGALLFSFHDTLYVSSPVVDAGNPVVGFGGGAGLVGLLNASSVTWINKSLAIPSTAFPAVIHDDVLYVTNGPSTGTIYTFKTSTAAFIKTSASTAGYAVKLFCAPISDTNSNSCSPDHTYLLSQSMNNYHIVQIPSLNVVNSSVAPVMNYTRATCRHSFFLFSNGTLTQVAPLPPWQPLWRASVSADVFSSFPWGRDEIALRCTLLPRGLQQKHLVIVLNTSGHLIAFSATNGSRVWETGSDHLCAHSPSVPTSFSIGRDIVTCQSPYFQNRIIIFAFHVDNGTLAWSHHASSILISTVAVLPDGVVYFTTRDLTVHALDAISGTELWTSGTNATSAAVASGCVWNSAAGVVLLELNIEAAGFDVGLAPCWGFAAGDPQCPAACVNIFGGCGCHVAADNETCSQPLARQRGCSWSNDSAGCEFIGTSSTTTTSPPSTSSSPAPPPTAACRPIQVGSREVDPSSWSPAFVTLDIGFTGQNSFLFSLCSPSPTPPSYLNKCNKLGFVTEYSGSSCVSGGAYSLMSSFAFSAEELRLVYSNGSHAFHVTVGCDADAPALTSPSGTYTCAGASCSATLAIQDLCSGGANSSSTTTTTTSATSTSIVPSTTVLPCSAVIGFLAGFTHTDLIIDLPPPPKNHSEPFYVGPDINVSSIVFPSSSLFLNGTSYELQTAMSSSSPASVTVGTGWGKTNASGSETPSGSIVFDLQFDALTIGGHLHHGNTSEPCRATSYLLDRCDMATVTLDANKSSCVGDGWDNQMMCGIVMKILPGIFNSAEMQTYLKAMLCNVTGALFSPCWGFGEAQCPATCRNVTGGGCGGCDVAGCATTATPTTSSSTQSPPPTTTSALPSTTTATPTPWPPPPPPSSCGDIHFPNGSTAFLSQINIDNFTFVSSAFLQDGGGENGVPNMWAFSPCAPFSAATSPSTYCRGVFGGQAGVGPASALCRYLGLNATSGPYRNGDFIQAVYTGAETPDAGLWANTPWRITLNMLCGGNVSLVMAPVYYAAGGTPSIHAFNATFTAFSTRFCATAVAPSSSTTTSPSSSSSSSSTAAASTSTTTTTTESPHSSSTGASPPSSSGANVPVVAAAAGGGAALLLLIVVTVVCYRRRSASRSAAAAAGRGGVQTGNWDGTSLLSRTSLSSSDDESNPPSSSAALYSPSDGGGGMSVPVPSGLGLSQAVLPAANNAQQSSSTASLHHNHQDDDAADDVTHIRSTAAPRITVPRNYAPPPSGNLASVLRSNAFLRSRFKHLAKIIDGAFSVAQDTEKKQQQRALAHPPLDLDECFTLALYSFDIGTGVPEDNFYFALNYALRRREEAGSKLLLQELTPFLMSFDKAWAKLPPQKCRVFRGIPITGTVEKVKKEMQPGRVLSWYAVASVTTDEKVAENFGSGTESGVMFVVSACDARSIAEYSSLPQENELLLQPGAQLLVTPPPPLGFSEPSNKNSIFVFVQQIQPQSSPFTDAEKV